MATVRAVRPGCLIEAYNIKFTVVVLYAHLQIYRGHGLVVWVLENGGPYRNHTMFSFRYLSKYLRKNEYH
jgi:hypothetical protein